MSNSVQADLQPVSMHRPWVAIIAVLLLAVAVTSVLWPHQRQGPKIGGPFQLVNAATGREVSDWDFRRKWLLILSGYTHCPDVCPTTLGNIAEAMSQLGPLAKGLQPPFITVDPVRDTMPVVYFAKRVIGDDYYRDHTATIRVVRPDGAYSSSLLSTAGPSDIAKRLHQSPHKETTI